MLFTAELSDRLGEHHHVKSHGVLPIPHIVPLEVLGLLVGVISDQMPELGIGHNDLESIPPHGHLLLT